MLAVDAEDAVQEVFLRLAVTLPKVPSSPEASFWIQRIARNYCLNEIRNKNRRKKLQDDLLVHEATVQLHPAEILIARILTRQIMVRKPDKMLAASWLYYVEGLTQEDVARVLGLSRRTIVTYLTEIRRRATKLTGAIM